MIVFVCHPYHRGGVTRWMVDAASHMATTGVDVAFVTVEPEKPFFSSGGNEVVIEMLKHHTGNLKVFSAKVGWEFELGSLEYRTSVYTKLLYDNIPVGATIIMSDDAAIWNMSPLACASYKILGVLHGNEDIYYNLVKQYHQYVHRYVCVSSRIARTLQEKVSAIHPDCILVIPCGIILPDFKPSRSQKSNLEIAFVGRVTQYQKRVLDIYNVAASLQNADINFKVHIIGKGSEKDTLDALFINNNMAENIVFHGWLSKSEIYDRLFKSDVLLLTSEVEGMPIAMMEGLACGCAVVATRISGVEDYEHTSIAENCLQVFAVGDAVDAAQQIRTIAQLPENIRQPAARSFAEQEFTMDVCINRYLALSESIDINPSAGNKYNGMGIVPKLLSYSRAFMRRLRLAIA